MADAVPGFLWLRRSKFKVQSERSEHIHADSCHSWLMFEWLKPFLSLGLAGSKD
jgi:hypothetical protein